MSLATQPLIEAEGLRHCYGRSVALDGVSFTVGRGEVYALLGRNGSGKTTLIRCLLGHQKASAGSLRLRGLDAWSQREAALARVGVVAEEPDAPAARTARELMRFCAALHPGWDPAAVTALLARFEVPLDRPSGQLSRGQKAQLALALALGPRPELLVLDDPTLGLDPVARRQIYDELLVELADQGTTVFITTHDLAGIEGLASRAGILRQGRLLAEASLEELKSRFRRLTAVQPVDAAALAPLGPIQTRRHALGWEAVVSRFDAAALAQATAGRAPVEVSGLSLEEIFVALAGPEGEVG